MVMVLNLFPSHQHSPVSLPNHWHFINAEVADITASNVYQQILFIFLYALYTLFALKFRNDIVKITITPICPPHPFTRTHTCTHSYRQACSLTLNQPFKWLFFPLGQITCYSTPISRHLVAPSLGPILPVLKTYPDMAKSYSEHKS